MHYMIFQLFRKISFSKITIISFGAIYRFKEEMYNISILKKQQVNSNFTTTPDATNNTLIKLELSKLLNHKLRGMLIHIKL